MLKEEYSLLISQEKNHCLGIPLENYTCDQSFRRPENAKIQ